MVPDELVDEAGLPLYYGYFLGDYADGVSTEEGDAYVRAYRRYGDLTDSDGAIVALWGQEATRTETYESVDSMNGLISYLAIYIGFVLVVACAAILTIQQLSGVADASGNFRILSELGTERRDIAHSVLAQQTVFFVFPLVLGNRALVRGTFGDHRPRRALRRLLDWWGSGLHGAHLRGGLWRILLRDLPHEQGHRPTTQPSRPAPSDIGDSPQCHDIWDRRRHDPTIATIGGRGLLADRTSQ